MENLNIKDIKAVVTDGEIENSLIRFETMDGQPVMYCSDGFYVDDDALECGDFVGEDEETWEAQANDYIADLGVRLGKNHGTWYELESL